VIHGQCRISYLAWEGTSPPPLPLPLQPPPNSNKPHNQISNPPDLDPDLNPYDFITLTRNVWTPYKEYHPSNILDQVQLPFAWPTTQHNEYVFLCTPNPQRSKATSSVTTITSSKSFVVRVVKYLILANRNSICINTRWLHNSTQRRVPKDSYHYRGPSWTPSSCRPHLSMGQSTQFNPTRRPTDQRTVPGLPLSLHPVTPAFHGDDDITMAPGYIPWAARALCFSVLVL
jgi:hypothetical protein